MTPILLARASGSRAPKAWVCSSLSIALALGGCGLFDSRETSIGSLSGNVADLPPDAGVAPRAAYATGCSGDSDCTLVRADCCDCSHAGMSTAVLASRAAAWEARLDSVCQPEVAGCTGRSLCDGLGVACVQGACVATGPAGFATNPPCAPGDLYNDDPPCAVQSVGLQCGPQKGDLSCYQRCASDSACADPTRPRCGTLALYAGTSAECRRKIKVCRLTADECP